MAKKVKSNFPCRDCKEINPKTKRRARYKLRDIGAKIEGPDDKLWMYVCGTHLAGAVDEVGGTTFVRTLT